MSFNTKISKPCSSLWNQMQWCPTSEQIEQFIELQLLLRSWNSQVNLTRLIEDDDYWINQIYDSIWPFKKELNNSPQNLQCVDVGSGCGLPGLALAIALPSSKITLIESIQRKTSALKSITQNLGLSNRITIINERVESSGHNLNLRNKFDVAMARAVASAPVVAEYLIPLLKPKGKAHIYKGKWSKTNQAELNKALMVLHAEVKLIENNLLPEERGMRNVIRIVSKGNCPAKYPRAIGVPTKSPLGN